MSIPVFLIDFENVQPKALARLRPGSARIKVFLGQNQSKLMLELVQALQPFGRDAQYIQINGSGPDAVDFHIAFYIGLLAAADPGTAFTIISKDKGFDPLVKHLASLAISCRRVVDIPVAPETTAELKEPLPSGAPVAPATKLPARAASVTSTTAPAPSAASASKPAVVGATGTAVAAKAPAKAAPLAKTSAPVSGSERFKVVVARLKSLKAKPAKVTTLRTTIASSFKTKLDAKSVEVIIQELKHAKKIVITGTKITYKL